MVPLPTDKSGKLCLDTIENYVKYMDEHVRKDQIVSPDTVWQAEVQLNNHSRAWIRFCKIGEGNNHS